MIGSRSAKTDGPARKLDQSRRSLHSHGPLTVDPLKEGSQRTRSMIHPVRGLAAGMILAVLLLGGWPALAEAASVHFRNDTSTPVIVRGASIINRVVRLGPP